MDETGWNHQGVRIDWEKKRTQNWALGHSSIIGQEIEELAKKTRRGVTCEGSSRSRRMWVMDALEAKWIKSFQEESMMKV